ncbi:MAG: YIP1 family protein [Gemmatimonadetes bacterium]|nr:YIP1 family protein [Gemmatimonadota bacterium]NNF39244.1 hypothetical protein [Gemmatimonadota bacterium]
MAQSFIDRMVGAATLDVATFDEVEKDTTATVQAAGVVALVTAAQAGAAMGAGPIGMATAAGSQLVGVGLWCAVTFLVGTRLFGGTATLGEVFRAVGFAFSPQILVLLGLLPFLGGFIGGVLSPILALWVLIAVVVGVRQSLDVSTLRAVFASILGAVGYLLLVILVPGL